MKKILVFKLVFITVLLFSASLAFAQGEDLIKAETELDESITDLNENELEATEKSDEEIVAEDLMLQKRITAFGAVLSFTKAELEELSVILIDLEYKFGDDLWDFYKAIRKHFIESEKERSAFAARVVDNDSNLTDIKALALEFKEWREGGYDEKNKAFFDFVLLARANDIMEVAEERVSKIDKDLDKFESDFGESGNLQLKILFAQAQLELGRGRDLYEEGNEVFEISFKNLFFPLEFASSAEELGTDVADIVDANDASVEEVTVSVREEIVSLIEGMIVRVQKAYKIFIDMSELAEQLLREE